MTSELRLDSEQLRELRMLLERELTSGQVELHHTSVASYKQLIHERLARLEAIATMVNSASPGQTQRE